MIRTETRQNIMRTTYILLASCLCYIVSCNEKTENVFTDKVGFAKSKVAEARQTTSLEINVEYEIDSIRLSAESFQIDIGNGHVKIWGGDSSGLMYGGLELAEQLELYGEAREINSSPDLPKRGIKFNIPLDARTPSYDDTGDAAQNNIAVMWEWDFWEEFLDNMAIYRYNTLTLWNPHPFPSMIRMEEYPDIGLDDVCVTTLSPGGLENEWGDPGLVSANVMDNLKVVKKITIDEKIAFWQKVMRYAKNRGIDIYFINWNISPNSVATPVEPYYKNYGINFEEKEKPGKYGITHELDNPRTVEYYRRAMKQFLLTYPDLKGIGVTAGEHMPKKWDTINREEWLWNTYGKGILDAKTEQPGRKVDFIHRVWDSDMDQIMRFWKDYPDKFEVSFKYAKARLYSSPKIPFADKHIKKMEQYGLKSWWNLRNDDIFVYRWGDPDYVREFFQKLPDKGHTAAYHMGSDGYVWGREFISKNDRLSGELEISKHWYNFMLWGRLGYDLELGEDFFVKKLEQRFSNTEGRLIYKTWQTASKIIPLVNSFHWRDWDHHWSVESCFSRPVLGGFREVTDFINNPTMQGSNMMNPLQYARAKTAGGVIEKTSPLEVAAQLNEWANRVLQSASDLQNPNNTDELKALLDDLMAMSYLGKYYSSKIEAAVGLALYKVSGNNEEKEKAVASLNRGVIHWKSYKKVSEKNYRPQMLARVYWLDWSQVLKYVVEDVAVASRYDPT